MQRFAEARTTGISASKRRDDLAFAEGEGGDSVWDGGGGGGCNGEGGRGAEKGNGEEERREHAGYGVNSVDCYEVTN